jgi:hypothetical protein
MSNKDIAHERMLPAYAVNGQASCGVCLKYLSADIKRRRKIMAENQELKSNQALCWQCGAVVYKGINKCPKCGAEKPAFSLATQRKVSKIFLRVGLPVGIVSLIVGIIMFGEGLSSMSLSFLLGPGLYVAFSLIAIGITGVTGGLMIPFIVKKREKLSAERTAQ